jgi:hypothetical protein
VSIVTIGIYTPRKVYVSCAAKPGHAIASARRLELAIDADGKPVRAEIQTSRRDALATLEQAGPETFRVHTNTQEVSR